MAHHLDNRRVNHCRTDRAGSRGASIVGGEHIGITIRQVIIQHREALTAPARPRAKRGRATMKPPAAALRSGMSAQTLSAASPDGYPADRKTAPGSGTDRYSPPACYRSESGALFRPMSNHRVLLAGFFTHVAIVAVKLNRTRLKSVIMWIDGYLRQRLFPNCSFDTGGTPISSSLRPSLEAATVNRQGATAKAYIPDSAPLSTPLHRCAYQIQYRRWG